MLKNYYKKIILLFIFPAWLFVSFISAGYIVKGLIWIISQFDKSFFGSINQSVLMTTVSAIVYLFTMAIVICGPWLIHKWRTNKFEIGLTRLPTWKDILVTPAGFIVYVLCSGVLILIASKIFPWFDMDQAQDVGFSQLSGRLEYILAFLTLVVVAPVAEELLFRGYLFGKLKKYVPIWLAIIVTSITFGAIHGAWNLAVDTFVLSVILCLLRQFTGNIWSSILLHMLKNGIAFYLLFINPTILATLVR